MRTMPAVLLVVAFLVCPALADETLSDTPKTTTELAAEPAKITLDAQDAKPSEAIESMVKQSKENILTESTVKQHVTFKVEDVSLETALTAFCTSGRFEWRKVYLDPKSKLLEQPGRLAATVRLVSGLGFPDIVVAGSSTKKVAVHSEGAKGAKEAESRLVKELGLSPVYLITNDAAVAAKKAEGEKLESKAVDEYTSGTKKLMDLFMNMTPEERERAMVEALNLMDEVGPGYMSSVMRACPSHSG